MKPDIQAARWRKGKQLVHGTARTVTGHSTQDDSDPEYRAPVSIAGFARRLDGR